MPGPARKRTEGGMGYTEQWKPPAFEATLKFIVDAKLPDRSVTTRMYKSIDEVPGVGFVNVQFFFKKTEDNGYAWVGYPRWWVTDMQGNFLMASRVVNENKMFVSGTISDLIYMKVNEDKVYVQDFRFDEDDGGPMMMMMRNRRGGGKPPMTPLRSPIPLEWCATGHTVRHKGATRRVWERADGKGGAVRAVKRMVRTADGGRRARYERV